MVRCTSIRIEGAGRPSCWLWLLLALSVGGIAAVGAVESVSPFADERAAMARVEQAPTVANLAKLADVRHRRAGNFLALFEEDGDPNALRQALAYAESATGLQADDAVHWRLLGQVYARFDGVPSAQLAAERALERAVELAPADAELRILLAQQLMTRSRYDAVLEHWEHVAFESPRHMGPVLIGSLATTYLLDQQAARGVRVFGELRAAHPDVAEVELGLAVLLRGGGEPDRAAQVLARLIDRADVGANIRRYALRLRDKWRHVDGAGQ